MVRYCSTLTLFGPPPPHHIYKKKFFLSFFVYDTKGHAQSSRAAYYCSSRCGPSIQQAPLGRRRMRPSKSAKAACCGSRHSPPHKRGAGGIQLGLWKCTPMRGPRRPSAAAVGFLCSFTYAHFCDHVKYITQCIKSCP